MLNKFTRILIYIIQQMRLKEYAMCIPRKMYSVYCHIVITHISFINDLIASINLPSDLSLKLLHGTIKVSLLSFFFLKSC